MNFEYDCHFPVRLVMTSALSCLGTAREQSTFSSSPPQESVSGRGTDFVSISDYVNVVLGMLGRWTLCFVQ